MPDAKNIEQKMQRFNHVLFIMMSFSAKNLEKTILLGEEKKLKV